MQLYTNSIQDRYGNAIKGAQITVRTSANALATLYSDNGVTLTGNPLATDSTGEFAFYAANGRYTFVVAATGMQSEIVSAFELQDALEAVASTAADRVQTGLDKTATAADRVQTGQDKAATAADLVQTGLDRTATGDAANAANLSVVTNLGHSTDAALSEYNAKESERKVNEALLTSPAAAAVVVNLAASGGSALVGHVSNVVGAVAMPSVLKFNERVSLFDMMTAAQRTDWANGALALDHKGPLQALIDACSGPNMYGRPKGIMNRGRGKILSSLICPAQFLELSGDSINGSQIVFDGVAGSCITTAVIPYFRPVLRDFNISGNAASGAGLDFTNVSAQVYLGLLENLTIYSGGDCIKAPGTTSPNFFSNTLRNIHSYSYNGHSFRVYSGPGNTFSGLYALRAGPGKAGFRMAGMVVLNTCNGLNEGDFWGTFGNDLTALDGFQADFGSNDFPDVTLIGCNVEEFSSLTANGSGILLHNGHRQFSMLGGKIDRSRPGLTAAIPGYHSIIRARKGPNSPGNPIKLSPGSIYMGASVANGAPLFTDTGAAFSDEIGSFGVVGITKYRNQGAGISYPLLTYKTAFDVYGDNAHGFNALTARRITAQVIRFSELAAAPVGIEQTVDVTGFTKVIATPAASASIARFSFASSPGVAAGDDYLRNGELIIEAGNANLTLVHNYAAANGVRLKGGVNLVMAAGQIVRLMRSANFLPGVAGWVEC
jgi:hypothetical protein